jgi:Skp family chaperone for outer membrane proteins
MKRLLPGFAFMIFLLGLFFCSMQQSSASQSDKIRIALFNRQMSPLKEMPASSFDSFERKFVEKNNISVLLNLAEVLNSGSLVYWAPELDVTENFIKSYKENEKTGTMPLLEAPIPETKTARIDMPVFPEKIRRLARVYKEVDQKFINRARTPTLKEEYMKSVDEQTKPIRDSLFLALAAFAKERNINLILNTAGTRPSSIGALPSIDITKSFIEKYNKDNP